MRARISYVHLLLIAFGAAAGWAAIFCANFAYTKYLDLMYGTAGREIEYFWMHDKLLGWRNRPDVSAVFASRENRFSTMVEINSQGFRGPPVPEEKPDGEKRILLVGDSYPAGFEVPNDALLSAVLEELLQERGSYRVINAGVRGWGTDQSYLFLTGDGIKLQPDIVIYFFTGNDPQDNVMIHRGGRKFGKSYFELTGGKLHLKGVPVPEHFDPNNQWLAVYPEAAEYHSRAERESKEFYAKRKTERFLALPIRALDEEYKLPKKSRDLTRREFELTEAIIAEMARFTKEHKAEFIVYEVSPGNTVPTKDTEIERRVKKLGLDIILSRFPFAERSGATRKFCHPNDLHWNKAGHALAAEVIYEHLLKRQLI